MKKPDNETIVVFSFITFGAILMVLLIAVVVKDIFLR